MSVPMILEQERNIFFHFNTVVSNIDGDIRNGAVAGTSQNNKESMMIAKL